MVYIILGGDGRNRTYLLKSHRVTAGYRTVTVSPPKYFQGTLTLMRFHDRSGYVNVANFPLNLNQITGLGDNSNKHLIQLSKLVAEERFELSSLGYEPSVLPGCTIPR